MLTTIPRYTQVAVLERSAEWAKVKYNGYTGYVMTRFLSSADPAIAREVPPETQTAGTMESEAVLDDSMVPAAEMLCGFTTEAMEIYPECLLENPLFAVPAETKVDLLMIGNEWCAVEYQNLTGYCLTEKLVVGNE